MTPETFQELVALWQQGGADWPAIEQTLRTSFGATASTPDVQVDLDRLLRCGYPEVVYGTGKTPQAIVDVFEAQLAAGQNSLATRVSPEQAETICSRFPDAISNPIARTIALTRSPVELRGQVVVVTAGTSDRPIAEEAVETARWMGCHTDLVIDVGVAGPLRLLARRERLQKADAIVVVAGMEGALPSAVAGWVAVPIIAVPTSVGYGANLGGFSALLSMLNSCAANVAVVNIDAGFKGGYLASMIARQSCTSANP
jgi:NCAIR mutase (PurE)-related protein